MDELIRKLAEAWGPSGFEHHVRDMIRAEVADLADEITVDPLGNLICRMGSGPKRVMTAAHMDEIGIIVSHIDRQGYARFAPIGAVFPAMLLGTRVRFENGVVGTVGVEKQFSSRRDLPTLDGFYIDISANAGGNAAVNVGDPGAFVGSVEWREDRLIGKSLDDRLGCAIQIEVMRRIKAEGTPHTVYFVFTVQEEVGVRGAGPAAFGVDPHLALVLDVTSPGDTPHGKKAAIELGSGVALMLRDARHITPPAVRDLLEKRAEAAGIPCQRGTIVGAGTDAGPIHTVLHGVPTGSLGIPLRYVHTPSETADRADIQAAEDLMVAVISQDFTL